MEADKKLYERFLQDDRDAFEQLVLKYKDNLIYFLQRYVRDIDQSEDIAQEVFAFIYVYKEKYNFQASFKTYLFTIARNKAVDYIRKHHKIIVMEQMPEEHSDEEELLKKVLKDEDSRLLHTAIKKMKAEYQTAIYLIDFEQLSYQETADIMGKTTSQIKILIFRARKMLKNLLVKEGYMHENR